MALRIFLCVVLTRDHICNSHQYRSKSRLNHTPAKLEDIPILLVLRTALLPPTSSFLIQAYRQLFLHEETLQNSRDASQKKLHMWYLPSSFQGRRGLENWQKHQVHEDTILIKETENNKLRVECLAKK